MHNAITWSSLFGVGFLFAGLVCVAGGGLAVFAAGMSDDPTAGDNASRQGCVATVIGGLLIIAGVWLLRP